MEADKFETCSRDSSGVGDSKLYDSVRIPQGTESGVRSTRTTSSTTSSSKVACTDSKPRTLIVRTAVAVELSAAGATLVDDGWGDNSLASKRRP